MSQSEGDYASSRYGGPNKGQKNDEGTGFFGKNVFNYAGGSGTATVAGQVQGDTLNNRDDGSHSYSYSDFS